VALRDATFAPPPPQHQGQLDFYAPFWVDNSRFLVSHAGKPYPAQAQFFLHNRTAPDNSDPGVGGDKNIDLARYQVVASRTGKRLAVFEADTAGGQPSEAKIILYTTDGNPGDPYFINGSPQHGDVPMCKLTLPPAAITDANLASPTFSYDGRELAWTENDGVHVADVSALNTGTDVENVPECTTVAQRLLIPGATEPFFSHGSESRPPTLTASFSFSPRHPWARRTVQFNGGRSHDRAGRIVSYRWSFGDGSGASGHGPRTSHAYRRAGHYTVTLTVTDNLHHRAKARGRVSVTH
jgi:chitodextrinase